ncbi:conserved hypothetical protein [Ricinus communis]|uniref:Uncharacterized protein n=1 Tax=Ricinus communis TaxID=3988 RepID=B9RJY5_RICCO|nr:conserved hypothetical protein [Ricinus communis]
MIVQIKSYYGISRNLLIKFKDDAIDETSTLAQDLPDVPPAMADAVNRGKSDRRNTMGDSCQRSREHIGCGFQDSSCRNIQRHAPAC